MQTFIRMKSILPGLNERRLTKDDFPFGRSGSEVYPLLEFLWFEAAFHKMISPDCHLLCVEHKWESRKLALLAMMPRKDIPALIKDYGKLSRDTQELISHRLRTWDTDEL